MATPISEQVSYYSFQKTNFFQLFTFFFFFFMKTSVLLIFLSGAPGYLLFSVFFLLVLFWVYLFHLSSKDIDVCNIEIYFQIDT